ncbi:TRAP transporter substrate-binding protein [Salibacterium aidingense]|uniref:TRAP transporter substrate-binding protein n=1 Tax=Salibacterium aidingense TaxID=384933 RepID=UPI003BD29D3A
MNQVTGKVLFVSIFLFLLTFVSACGSEEQSEGADSNGSSEDGGETNAEESSGESVEFKFGHMSSPEHVQHTGAMVPFTEDVEDLTEGRVTFEMYPGGALSSEEETFNNTVDGIQDASWAPAGYSPGQFTTHSIINLPFVAQGSAEHVSVVAQKIYEEFPSIQEEYEGVKPLWFHGTDEYVIMTNGQPVRSFEDVKGLQLRAPNPEGADMIEAWGATSVSIPATEAYEAMQKGTVDGTVLPIAALKDFDLFDVVDYVTHGNFTNSVFWTAMNENSWNRISEEDRAAIEDELIKTQMTKRAGAAFDGRSQEAKQEAEAEGIEFITLPEEELQKFEEKASPIIEEWISDREAEGLPGQEIYDRTTELMEQDEITIEEESDE